MEDSAIPVKNLHREYGRICQGGIADSANHTSTDINKDTSSSEETPETNLKPSPNYEKAEAGLFSQKDLRDAVAKLDNALVLQNNSINDRLLLQKNFYKQAPAFMFKNNLSLDYLSWLCEKVKKQNYTSFKGLYYSLFFQEVTVEEYKSSLNFTKAPPPEIKIVCPVCGESHAESDDSCPSCRLPKDSKKETVLLFRELQKLPPEKRGEYLRREDEIANEFGFKDLTKSMEALAALKQEFGLSS